MVINLKRNNFVPIQAGSGEEAIKLYKQNDDIFLALLDISLPGISGLEVCEFLRAENPKIGIIMLTARTQESDKIQGLSSGADDYVTKPFSPKELMARIESLHRRIILMEEVKAKVKTKTVENIEIRSGEFFIDVRKHTLQKNYENIELTQVEFQILEYLLSSAGSIVSRSDILLRVWGEGYVGEEKIVDVNIRRLRLKIEDDASNPKYLKTVWGVGYKWEVSSS